MDYETWLLDNPPPTLADLIEKHGGYHQIPDQAWAAHEAAWKHWHERLRNRHREQEVGGAKR